MKLKIQKWGNSLALRIPSAFAKHTEIKEDDIVEVNISDNKIIIEPVKKVIYSLETLLSKVSENNIHYETDFGKPEGNELW